MPTTIESNRQIAVLTTNFVAELSRAVEADVQQRMMGALAAFGGSPMRRGPGRPRKDGGGMKALQANPFHAPVLLARKKAPKQLCPVPNCKNPAAPVFNMVCAKHKDLPKAKIKKYREARRKRVAASAKTGRA